MIKISTVKKEDVSTIVALEMNELNETLGADTLDSFIDNPLMYLYKAVTDNKLIGYISANIYEGSGEIMNFAVAKVEQRQGIGTRLLAYLVEQANVKSLTLEVKATNQNAIAFYLKNGFKQISIRKKYYKGEIDALVMMKEYL